MVRFHVESVTSRRVAGGLVVVRATGLPVADAANVGSDGRPVQPAQYYPYTDHRRGITAVGGRPARRSAAPGNLRRAAQPAARLSAASRATPARARRSGCCAAASKTRSRGPTASATSPNDDGDLETWAFAAAGRPGRTISQSMIGRGERSSSFHRF